jgi:hypothetical protein
LAQCIPSCARRPEQCHKWSNHFITLLSNKELDKLIRIDDFP